MRGMLKQKKIGHTGTLDPAAEGVLPVCLGKGTRLCDLLTDKSKTYRAVMLLGVETDTQDTTGQILREGPVQVTEEDVRREVLGFVGDYDQIPPMYSALKVNGKKLYELAREGVAVSYTHLDVYKRQGRGSAHADQSGRGEDDGCEVRLGRHRTDSDQVQGVRPHRHPERDERDPAEAVSYTHLDVYKRPDPGRSPGSGEGRKRR